MQDNDVDIIVELSHAMRDHARERIDDLSDLAVIATRAGDTKLAADVRDVQARLRKALPFEVKA